MFHNCSNMYQYETVRRHPTAAVRSLHANHHSVPSKIAVARSCSSSELSSLASGGWSTSPGVAPTRLPAFFLRDIGMAMSRTLHVGSRSELLSAISKCVRAKQCLQIPSCANDLHTLH